jgi:hypothetical protein
VDGVHLIGVLRGLVVEDEDERGGVGAINYRAIGRRGLADITVSDTFDRHERAKPRSKLFSLGAIQIVAKPEINGVDEHAVILRSQHESVDADEITIGIALSSRIFADDLDHQLILSRFQLHSAERDRTRRFNVRRIAIDDRR